MKAVQINAKNPQRLVNALVAIRTRFVYEYGSIYLLGTDNVYKIKSFLERNEISTEDMFMNGIDYEF